VVLARDVPNAVRTFVVADDADNWVSDSNEINLDLNSLPRDTVKLPVTAVYKLPMHAVPGNTLF